MTPRFRDLQVTTEPGNAAAPSEDWAAATADLIVVLDGATARTDTGCVHGIAWYADRLGQSILRLAADPDRDLPTVLAESIGYVAAQHPECDLSHPGTPSAGVAILRADGRYLVLGDVTIAAETDGESPQVIVDPRVEQTASAERAEVDRYLIGTPEKAAALVPMKRAELAARNKVGGYWIAATDPTAADHALTGMLPMMNGARIAVLTDGAARAVSFGLLGWEQILGGAYNAERIVAAVRDAEASDPLGARWPRNKASDDATAVVASIELGVGPT